MKLSSDIKRKGKKKEATMKTYLTTAWWEACWCNGEVLKAVRAQTVTKRTCEIALQMGKDIFASVCGD